MKEKNERTKDQVDKTSKTKEAIEETMQVGKRKVETGKVTLTKRVLEEDVPLNFTGIEEEIDIDVKKIGKVVEEPGPAVRTEGDTTIISVFREVFVKQTILEEEVWVTKKHNTKTFESPQKLRKEVIDIKRTPEKPHKKH